jgi:hypothetical protein
MKSPVRPELPTASVGSSQAPTAAVDNSAPSVIRPESTYKSGNAVQTTGATSVMCFTTQILQHGKGYRFPATFLWRLNGQERGIIEGAKTMRVNHPESNNECDVVGH